jgi:hypothetical protein
MKTIAIIIVGMILLISCKNETDVAYSKKNFEIFSLGLNYSVYQSALNNVKVEQEALIEEGIKFFHKGDKLSIDELAEYNNGENYILITPTVEDKIKANNLIWIIDKIDPQLDEVQELCKEYVKIYKKGKNYDNLGRVMKHSEFNRSRLDHIENQIKIVNDQISKRTGFPTVEEFVKEYHREPMK